jgi:hypothetical protein
MKRAQALQIGLPTVIVAVGLVTAAVANRSDQPVSHRAPASDKTDSTSPMASPSESPEITVNGEPVHLDSQGRAMLNTGDSHTSVQKSDDHTTVTTVGPGSSTTTTSGNGNLNISVQSTTGNTGSTTSTHSQVHQDSRSSSSNSTHTMVITHGSVTSN